MNRALTDLEFMAYEAVLYLRFLSEDYPFLTARRPKLEEWLRQLRTDGPGSEGKRSCQVPEQALKLLEEAERELEESDGREQAELLKKYPLPFPEDKGIDRDSLLLAADRALEQETAGLEALFPERDFSEKLWKIFFENLSGVPVGRDEATEKAIRRSGQECTQVMRKSFPTDSYGLTSFYRKAAERCIGAWTDCLCGKYGSFLSRLPDRERAMDELGRRLVRNPFPDYHWAGSIMPSGALLQRNIALHVQAEIRHSLTEWAVERKQYRDFFRKTLFRFLAEETKRWEEILRRAAAEGIKNREENSAGDLARRRRHREMIKYYRMQLGSQMEEAEEIPEK